MARNDLPITFRLDPVFDFILFVIILVLFHFPPWWDYLFAFWFIFVIAVIFFRWKNSKTFRKKYKELLKKDRKLATKAESLGIGEIFNMRDTEDKKRRNKIISQIVERGDKLHLLCETGHSYFYPEPHRHWPIVQEKLSNGTPFKVLFFHPKMRRKKFS